MTNIVFRTYFRLTRGMTLGGRGIIVDAQGRILLLRHGYTAGWHFPGGGVEWNEPIETATVREIQEETGIVVTGPLELHGIFCQSRLFPRDHVGVYIVRDWEQPEIPGPNMEVREQKFFALDGLPDGITKGTQNRIDEVFGGKEIDLYW